MEEIKKQEISEISWKFESKYLEKKGKNWAKLHGGAPDHHTTARVASLRTPPPPPSRVAARAHAIYTTGRMGRLLFQD
jgi:hypothetical protein